MSKDKSLVEKKLRGSGGYAIAKISDDEQKKANLGGPELFLAGIGRLEDDRFKKYYCNKCEKEYQGGPNIEFENPNEDLGENIILIEKGEYKCKTCNYVIAQYRKFNESNNEKEDDKNSQSTDYNNRTKGEEEQAQASSKTKVASKSENTVKDEEQTSSVVEVAAAAAAGNDKGMNSKSDYVQIEKIKGMLTYDHNARLIGRVDEIGLRKTSDGRVEFSFKVKDSDNSISEIAWNRISKIGDIIILSSSSGSNTGNISKDTTNINTSSSDSKSQGKFCSNCNYSNEAESVFCEECGKKLE
ncbi:MAG TPA: zinc ribbon domain-containing protein [Candidatus Nitrosocosmicus sp.]|nr:zinc ribbon domain-containing protein [Candidatus Nitrosocosmicus sp.]